MKHHSLVQFVFKLACFLRKQILQFQNSFIFNFEHQTNKWWYFFEQGWGKFEFGKNFLKHEGLTLRHYCQKNTFIFLYKNVAYFFFSFFLFCGIDFLCCTKTCSLWYSCNVGPVTVMHSSEFRERLDCHTETLYTFCMQKLHKMYTTDV